MALWMLNATFPSTAVIPILATPTMTALDWSLLALGVGILVLRCTYQTYDWLIMIFERPHCVEISREMDVGNTALYQLCSRYSWLPRIDVLQMPLTQQLFLESLPSAAMNAQLEIPMEFNDQITGLPRPEKSISAITLST